MGKENPVLIMDIDGELLSLEIRHIDSENIPDSLNGESGFHVYHVRILTELILRQLAKSGHYPLSDEEITAMSIASSLHDIGKNRIPKSILDFPGRLSPVEYDIVKKHASIGAEMIGEAKGDIDPVIIKHAQEIARSHHERFDGTGYPDGSAGDSIPISAQVVSLADAFDALTSSRSYKKAFSQDVAIEMISNGMCGVFNPLLIDCLLQVVNNKVLTDIREGLEKKRAVVLGQNIFAPKRVLFAGNTAFVTERLIDESFYDSDILIVGETGVKSGGKIKVYGKKEISFDAIFETYDFDLVVYLAGELTYGVSRDSDAEELRELLRALKDTSRQTRFLYLSSLDAAFDDKSDRALLSHSKEELCEYFRNEFNMEIRVVRIPYLYLGSNKEDYFYSIFKKMEKGGVIELAELPSSKSFFLSPTDLADFLVRFTDNWKSGVGILNINDEFKISFSQIAQKLSSLKNGVEFSFKGEAPSSYLASNNKALRNEYGWFARISILEDLEEQYELYIESTKDELTTLSDKIAAWLKSHTLFTKVAELLILFIISEIFVHMTGSAVLFSIVDFRMAYTVIIATLHGLTFGMAAAGLCSLAWFFSKIAAGAKWLTIFYEPSNWFAFVLYFLTGALCGYINLRKENNIKYLSEQNTLLENKLIFTRDLYNDTFNEKRALKKQIIGSRDSFGKIFDITRQLDTVEPRKLYLKIMDTFEEVLENKSIAVYSVNENSSFGRLEAASRDILSEASRSIDLSKFAPVTEKLLRNEVWRNTEFIPGLPMFAAEASRGKKLELMIFIWHCEPEQKTLYYVNLFKILCDLVEMSLLRAYDYNQMAHNQHYISDTRILNSDEFEKVYDSFKKMAERKIFSYIQLEIDLKEHTLDEADDMLEKLVRSNDIMGINRDGKLRVLLSQATKNDLSFILPRFSNLDIGITVLED